MAEAITCSTTDISTETLERGSYVRLADGSYAKRIVIVSGGDGIHCSQTGIGTMTMRRGSYVELSPGQYAQQVIDET